VTRARITRELGRLVELAGDVLLLLLVGFLLGLVVAAMASPDCPTEDSCRADYHDGRYVITPVVP